jgi:hypothetical protein
MELWFLKTDMQGWDAKAITSGGSRLRRAHYVHAETWLLDAFPYGTVSSSAANSYCDDLLPHMLRSGFIPVGLKAVSGLEEREIAALRDPQLRRDETRGPWEGINQFLFLHGANSGVEAHAKIASKASVALVKARQVCERQRAYLKGQGAAPGLKEADAFFVRNDTNLLPPPVLRADWPQAPGRHEIRRRPSCDGGAVNHRHNREGAVKLEAGGVVRERGRR